MADAPLTFRERIMRHWVARFEAQQEGVANATITWDEVSRKPLSKEQLRSGRALGIYDTSERVSKEIGMDMRALNIVFEFTCLISEGDDPETILNATLGEVQRVAGLDPQCGEPSIPPGGMDFKLALNTEEQGSEIDIGGEKPTTVSGMVIYRVTYRTKTNNPFTR